MVSFQANKIYLDSETISEQLRGARQARGLKLGDVAKKLKINYKYLEALEKNRFEKLPAGVYGKNFLREYAVFLGLDDREMIKIFEQENAPARKQFFSVQVVKNLRFIAIPKVFKNFLILSTVTVCFVYLGLRLDKIVSPPALSVNNPAENLITSARNILVSGSTEAETEIVINGEQILSGSDGAFSKEVDLKSGMNTITVTAIKKYGRESTVTRQILVKA